MRTFARATTWALQFMLILVVGSTNPTVANALYVNEDVRQQFSTPQDNFEIVISGDVRANIATGSPGYYRNSFPNGGEPQSSYNASTNETTISFTGDAIAQQPANGTTHFGFIVNGPGISGGVVEEWDRVVRKTWTEGPTATADVPAVAEHFTWTEATGIVDIEIVNLSLDTFSIFEVGSMFSTSVIPLGDLNRTTMPPGSFSPSGIVDGTELLPGESVAFSVGGVSLGESVTTFIDAQFSGVSGGNDYTGFVGEWVEFVPMPEPNTAVLLTLGLVGLAVKRRGASRFHVG